jgi:tetratricopeptide (TPR) repeat protein
MVILMRLHHSAMDALRALAVGCAQRDDREAALRYAQQWIAADPWHEGAQRALMRALAQNGRRAEALAQYETCRRALHNELSVDPTQETTALYEAIRDGTALPGRTPWPQIAWPYANRSAGRCGSWSSFCSVARSLWRRMHRMRHAHTLRTPVRGHSIWVTTVY